jgi:hypothetical protein
MINASHELGWWIASDGNWYPPELHPDALTERTDTRADLRLVETVAEDDEAPPKPGWWVASDGKWYPPELHPLAGGGEAATADALPAAPMGDTEPMKTPEVRAFVVGSPAPVAAGGANITDAINAGAEPAVVLVDVDLALAGMLGDLAGDAMPALDFDAVAEIMVAEAAVTEFTPVDVAAAADAVATPDAMAEPASAEPASAEPASAEPASAEPASGEPASLAPPAKALAGEPPPAEATTVTPPKHAASASSPFSSSDWLPGGPFGLDAETAARPEAAGRSGLRRRRKH